MVDMFAAYYVIFIVYAWVYIPLSLALEILYNC